MPMRARFIFNPQAGRNPARRRRQYATLRRELDRLGWRLDAEPAEVVVVCGGDGTLHRVVNEWAERPGPHPVLAVAPPWGTANILAHALGVPADPARAARWLAQALPQPLPLARAETPAGRRYFFAVASVGFDAEIVHALSIGVGAERKRRWGKLAFALEALRQWHRPMPEGVIFSLTPFFAGRYRLGTPGADGTQAYRLSPAPADRVRQLLALAAGKLERARGVERLPPGEVTVTQAGAALELDGEPAGRTPATLALAGVNLRVLVR